MQKKAQDYLKSKLNNGIKKLKDQEKKLQEEEKNYSTKNLFHLKNTKRLQNLEIKFHPYKKKETIY